MPTPRPRRTAASSCILSGFGYDPPARYAGRATALLDRREAHFRPSDCGFAGAVLAPLRADPAQDSRLPQGPGLSPRPYRPAHMGFLRRGPLPGQGHSAKTAAGTGARVRLLGILRLRPG